MKTHLVLLATLLLSPTSCQPQNSKTQPTTPASASALSIPKESNTLPQTTASPTALPSTIPSASPSEQSGSDIQPGERFSLKQGESAQFQTFTLSFSEVLTDSRCPMNAQCIWAGEVKIRLNVTENNSKRALDFTLPGQGIQSLNSKYQVQLLSVAEPPREIELQLLESK